MTELFTLHSWPRAIAHIDGDAFFTSRKEATHPELKGKALITGGERGIVACASYAAKKAGVKRGVPLHEARKICPGLIILPSDYETYSLFSRRMFNIIRLLPPLWKIIPLRARFYFRLLLSIIFSIVNLSR
jgi:DNA polymerase IV